MGYYTSNPIVTDTIEIGSAYTEANDFVEWVKSNLEDAGWSELSKVTAEISLAVLAIVPGNEITLGPTIFKFFSTTDPAPGGGIPVPIAPGDTTDTILNTWGSLVRGSVGWQYQRPSTTTIRFYGNENEEIDNNILCFLNPTGTIGVWSSDAGSTGVGFTFRGGWIMQSHQVYTNPLKVKFVTNGSSTRVNFSDSEDICFFDGLQTENNELSIVANRYQFFIFVAGEFGNGTLMLASHLKPLGGLFYCNYMSGPINPVSPSGGNRQDLTSVGGVYYVDVSTDEAYFANDGTGTTNQRPALCFPGLGFGKADIDKLANQIETLDLVKDDGMAIPYEAFLALSVVDPTDPLAQYGILGAFWDSVVFPIYDARDTEVIINGDPGIVLLSQTGASSNTRGSFVIRTA